MPPYTSELDAATVDVNNQIVEETVKNAASLGCPVLVHAEDYESCACGIKTAKEKHKDGLSAWSESRSPEFEAKAIKTRITSYNVCYTKLLRIWNKIAIREFFH